MLDTRRTKQKQPHQVLTAKGQEVLLSLPKIFRKKGFGILFPCSFLFRRNVGQMYTCRLEQSTPTQKTNEISFEKTEEKADR